MHEGRGGGGREGERGGGGRGRGERGRGERKERGKKKEGKRRGGKEEGGREGGGRNGGLLGQVGCGGVDVWLGGRGRLGGRGSGPGVNLEPIKFVQGPVPCASF